MSQAIGRSGHHGKPTMGGDVSVQRQSDGSSTDVPPPPTSDRPSPVLSRSDKKTTLSTHSGRFALRRRSSDDSTLELMQVSSTRHLTNDDHDDYDHDDDHDDDGVVDGTNNDRRQKEKKVRASTRRKKKGDGHDGDCVSSLDDDSIDLASLSSHHTTRNGTTFRQRTIRSSHHRRRDIVVAPPSDDSADLSVDLSTDSVATSVQRQPKRFRRNKGRRPTAIMGENEAPLSDGTTAGKTRTTLRFVVVLLSMLAAFPLVMMMEAHTRWTTEDRIVSGLEQQHERIMEEFKQNFPPPKHLHLADPYTPVLRPLSDASSEFYNVAANNNATNTTTILHFVKSRFMQYQPRLRELGWARLELFREFCLPSMLKQTTQNFLWLIYTDPDLDPDLLKAMAELLAPYPHYYLIKSLSNHMWKGGQALNMTRAQVYSGQRTRLEAAMALRDTLPILETRLDADDAIHVGYLEEVQKQAIPMFTQQSVRWMYWCVVQELEWNWVGPTGYSPEQRDYGIMESKPYVEFCPTPGLTLGHAAATSVDTIYSRKHSVLVERLNIKEDDFCGPGRPGKDCYQIVTKFEYPAFRCRTPTSASMVMSDYSNEDKLKKRAKADLTDKRWSILHESFGVPRSNVHKANDYLTRNILKIAEDAIMGQCTKGHSCSVCNITGVGVARDNGPMSCCSMTHLCSVLLFSASPSLQKAARAKLQTVIGRYQNLTVPVMLTHDVVKPQVMLT